MMPVLDAAHKMRSFILAGEVSRKGREIVKNCEGQMKATPLSVKQRRREQTADLLLGLLSAAVALLVGRSLRGAT